MNPIIKVEQLSKQYRIGASQAFNQTLRDTLASAARKPLNWIKRNGHAAKNTIWALKDVSFEVMPGEVVGIVGRNGAGKSTLLKILSRITAPTNGYADMRGRVGSLLEVGTGFHAELSGRENVYLNGAILGMKRSEIIRKFDEIVAFAEIEKFIDTPVKHYSSGMYMRLAFAVAAHLEPEILIVDEVLAVGDTAFQNKCLGKIEGVAKEGRTVLFVSHNTGAIQRLCSECKLLENGRLVAEGKPVVVLQKYLGLYQSGVEQAAPTATSPKCDVRLRVLDENGELTRVWRYGKELTIEVNITTKIPLQHPAVHVAFYAGKNVRLFALLSERMGGEREILQGDGTAIFRIRNPGFTVSEMYFDVGVKEREGTYFILITEAAWLSPDYGSVPISALTDCILYPTATHTWKIADEAQAKEASV